MFGPRRGGRLCIISTRAGTISWGSRLKSRRFFFVLSNQNYIRVVTSAYDLTLNTSRYSGPSNALSTRFNWKSDFWADFYRKYLLLSMCTIGRLLMCTHTWNHERWARSCEDTSLNLEILYEPYLETPNPGGVVSGRNSCNSRIFCNACWNSFTSPRGLTQRNYSP